MRTVPFLALALCLCGLATSAPHTTAQEPPKGAVAKPQAIYNQFRELITEAKFDVAANFLKSFLDSNPTDADFLEIEKKYGTTTFTNLRAIPRWSDNPAADKLAKDNVEEAVKRSREASAKLLRDPARVNKYVRNLGATYEERVFAELELRRTGDFAIPYMVEQFRTTADKELYSGILGAITKLEGHTMAGWIAAFDGFTPDQQYGVLVAIAARPDVAALQTAAQSDLAPHLWRIIAQPAETNPTLRAFAESLLNKLHPGTKAASRIPEEELFRIARTFYDRTARFSGAKNNADGSPSTVPLWVWDAKDPQAPKLTKLEDVPIGQAEEYFGLRYARWALDRRADYEPAQILVLSLAAERAIERAKFGNLATAEPAVFKLLSEAPSSALGDMLTRGINQKKPGLALAALQALGDRGDKNTTATMVKALDYPDPQVQIHAANALLRSPVPIPPEVRGKIVEILRRAAAANPLTPANAKGTALVTDPNKFRADAIAVLLRGLGYNVEVFTNGRDLLRRVARASDFDLVFIDHHSPNPELIDLVGQLQGDVNSGRRLTFVIASADKPRVPTFDQLVVRFAALIAATENEVVAMEPPFVSRTKADTTDGPDADKKQRRDNQKARDSTFSKTVALRMARLQRVVDSTGIELSPVQKLLFELRLELITYAVMGAEFPISPLSAPETAERISQIRRQIQLQPQSPPYGVGTPTHDLLKLMERFEIDVGRVPAARKRFEDLYSKVDAVELGLPVETFRDPALEAKLARTLRGYPAVRIMPEPFGRSTLAAYLEFVQTDPAQAPRDPAEKKAAQKVAVEWLRKMATSELTGFDVKSAEAELRDAIRVDDLAEAAIDGASRFGSADVQQTLLNAAVSMTPQRPLPIRQKAADATIRHVQVNGKSVPKALLDQLTEAADKEPDLTLRGKLQTLKGLLVEQPAAIPDPQNGKPVPNPAAFVNQLKGYNPPLLPPPPAKEPPKDPKEAEPKKDP